MPLLNLKKNDIITIYQMLAHLISIAKKNVSCITFYSYGTSISQGDKAGHIENKNASYIIKIAIFR